jgi:hypothetical protein
VDPLQLDFRKADFLACMTGVPRPTFPLDVDYPLQSVQALDDAGTDEDAGAATSSCADVCFPSWR